MFNLNDKVVCIDASITPHMQAEIAQDFEQWVKKDEVYTIRGFNENDGIVVGVLLNEVHNFPKYFRLIGKIQESAFKLDRFRKLETKTETIKEERYEEV